MLMDEHSFRHAVDAAMDVLLDQIDEIDSDDLDPSRTAGTLAVSFESSDAVILLSQQTPTREIWLSAQMTAWHFTQVGGDWVERDSGEPMVDVLGAIFTTAVGEEIRFTL
jgi:iron donor protein CyaY